MRRRVTAFRTTVVGIHGDVGLQTLGLWDPAPTQPDALEAQALRVIAALRSPKLTLTQLDPSAGVELRPATLAEELAHACDALHVALAEVSRERLEASTTVVAKDAAMAAHDRVFTRFVALVEHLARAGGQDALAERIRPSQRDPRRARGRAGRARGERRDAERDAAAGDGEDPGGHAGSQSVHRRAVSSA